MLFMSKTPLKFWVEAFYSANFISNLFPSVSLQNQSPFELLFNKPPIYSFLRVFSSACYPCLRSYGQHKFEPRSLQCVFLGYHPQYKGYRCLYPPTGRVYISRHVIFDEQCFPFAERYKDFTTKHASGLLHSWQSEDVYASPRSELPTVPPQVVEYPQQAHNTTSSKAASPTTSEDTSGCIQSECEETEASTSDQSTHPMITRSRADIYKLNPMYALIASKTIPALPQTVAEALRHRD